ncbi:hypothetical protein D9K79_08115 [Acinetobacter cumulans]|uniref:Zinc finger Ogr/Delta-type domain-containing protein n=1 Tax=Acinetobacter cumulans TaxID=2136182 RepID=A0ABX9U850_9GAMM|nr:ogr/Delta-like zinc finger family protein [Acinetobacter cumulans]RLL46406.1 hypothetical protein D9K79_08115 [Acinetobacter cumulans]
MGRKASYQCPHCKSGMIARSSREVHALLRDIFLQCSNYQCGFSAGGILEITHEISPSARPNIEIQLQTIKELTARRAANDDDDHE